MEDNAGGRFDYHCSCGRNLTARTNGMSKETIASILRTWLQSHHGPGHYVTTSEESAPRAA